MCFDVPKRGGCPHPRLAQLRFPTTHTGISCVVVNMFNQGSTGTDLDTNTDATIEITDTANTSLGLPAMQRLGNVTMTAYSMRQ